MYVIVTCKYEKDPIKNSQENVMTSLSPIITLWELSVDMETRDLILSEPKPNAAFLQSPMMLQIKFSEIHV